MAKLLIVLAAALLQVSAAPFDLNPLTWAFRGPKMGLEIASKAVGGVREGLENNNMGWVARPLGAVETGLNAPVGMLGNMQSKMPSFEIPSFGGDSGLFSGLGGDSGLFSGLSGDSGLFGGAGEGFGGMFNDFMAVPQKIAGQASSMFGQGEKGGLFNGVTDMFGSISGQAKNSVNKLQDALNEVQSAMPEISADQLAQLVKENAAKVQGKVQETTAGVKDKVGAAQKQVEEKVGAVQKQVEEKVGEVQKKIQEQVTKVQEEMAPKAKAMVNTIMADLKNKGAALQKAGDSEGVEAVKAQMQQVATHANDLMGKLQKVQSVEDAQKVAEQFVKDFTPMYEAAQQE